MVQNVVYKDDNLVAFNKPYGMAYSGAPEKTPQFDRILQDIKLHVAPKCERLYLVKSLDKEQSGILLFATNKLLQSELRDAAKLGKVEHVYRCIVRGCLKDSPVNITIPLIKVLENRDMKMVPLLSNNTRQEVLFVESACRTLLQNEHMSSLEVITMRDVPHQVRAHLSLVGCPLVGDKKYSNLLHRPPRLPHDILKYLRVSENQSRQIPMYLHMSKIRLPPIMTSAGSIHISAPMPKHFVWMLKKLKLLKIR